MISNGQSEDREVVISRKHKCIFVHVPKVAGQSIETSFLKDLGLTWEQRAELLLRKKRSSDALGAPAALAHLVAIDYVRYRYISESDFRKYYKFSFVRNPYTRVVSLYKYLGYQGISDFERFVQHILPKRLSRTMRYFVQPQAEYLFVDGECMVDFIGRFESLQADFRQVASKTGLRDSALPHVNESTGERKRRAMMLRRIYEGRRLTRPVNKSHWRDYYTEESAAAVADYYAVDFEMLGYERRWLDE